MTSRPLYYITCMMMMITAPPAAAREAPSPWFNKSSISCVNMAILIANKASSYTQADGFSCNTFALSCGVPNSDNEQRCPWRGHSRDRRYT